MLQSFYEYMIVLKTKELAAKSAVPAGVKKVEHSLVSGAILENLHTSPSTDGLTGDGAEATSVLDKKRLFI